MSRQIFALIILFTISATHLFAAAPHNPLKELTSSYLKCAQKTKVACNDYFQCLKQQNAYHPPCRITRELFIWRAQQLKSLHDQLAQQCTPEQLADLTVSYNNKPFNLLEPESPQHFEDVLVVQNLTGAYTDYEKSLVEAQNASSEQSQNIVPIMQYNQHRLQPILRKPSTAALIAKHAPEFYAAHRSLFNATI